MTRFDPAARGLEAECMSEDDFDLDDDVIDDDEGELLADAAPVSAAGGSVPVWRLIEMSRENRFLERELADFDDYDSLSDDYAGYGAH